jgi:hypothetical protein
VVVIRQIEASFRKKMLEDAMILDFSQEAICEKAICENLQKNYGVDSGVKTICFAIISLPRQRCCC